MTSADYLSIVCFLGALFLLTPIMGTYIAKVFLGEKIFLSPILGPVERFIYRISFINPAEEMHWKRYAASLLYFSGFGIITVFLLQVFQNILPLNPQHFSSVPGILAFNTAISFVTNTNWQAYAGETTISYLTSTLGLCVQNFASAATGIAVLFALIRSLKKQDINTIGNFYVDVARSFLYILLPLSLLLAILLTSQGVIQNFSPNVAIKTMEGKEQIIPMGPAASQIAIKQLGTNGGGFFSTNSAHPFENPTPFSNFWQMLAMILIPSALIYTFGLIINQRRHALMIYFVTLIFFLSGLTLSLWSEHLSNGAITSIDALEGKEMRFSKAESILWATITTATSNGSVNAMHDSLTPLAGGLALWQILVGEIIFGGVGSGLYGMLLFVLLTAFLAGLMVGRAPQYLGKKIEAFDMQMAVLSIVLPSIIVLAGASISSILPEAIAQLGNQGPHGLSEILYAWGSAANNNGSAFAGLNANTNYFNLGLSLAMLVGRFGIMLPVLAIAGNMANKKIMPISKGTLPTDTPIFGILLIFVIIIVGALTFLPALTLGPVVEHFLMILGRKF